MKPAEVDVAVVGAGVVGLAVAAELAAPDRRVAVFERHARPGLEASGSNSGVIHAGIHHPPGFLKTTLCIEGRELLYDWAARQSVPCARTGKLVVAVTAEDERALLALADRARGNAVRIELLGRRELRAREPRILGHSALWVPDAGLIRADRLVDSLVRHAIGRQVRIQYGSTVMGIDRDREGFEIRTRLDGGVERRDRARILINCAGAQATPIARLAGLDGPQYEQHLWKGSYFAVSADKQAALPALPVYPVVAELSLGLGIHFTPAILPGSRPLVGPDAEYLGRHPPAAPEEKKRSFVEAVGRYLPGLAERDLSFHGDGVRARLDPPGQVPSDFRFLAACEAGMPDFVSLLGIESPGLTACLAIARHVRSRLD